MRKSWVAIACLLLIATIAAGLAVVARQGVAAFGQAGAEILTNPGFEGGFYLSGGVGELEVGKSWQVWYDRDPTRHRPEYKPETRQTGRGRVRSGEYAQKLFTTFSAHDAGLYQEIYGVLSGQWYRFSAWAYQWSSERDDPDVSYKDGKCSVLVGINPWGDANPLARTTVWGREALQVYDEWVQVEVVAQAWSDKIAVALRQDCEWPVRHNDAYLDDAHLELAADMAGPTPTPLPTGICPTAEPGAGIDYDEIERLMREVVGTAVAEREPVRWPR